MNPSGQDLTVAWNGLELAGTLWLPGEGDISQPSPVVLMLQGSGETDRDSGGYFDPIRDALLDQGIATYSCDKPGCGTSTGDWRNYGIEGRFDQAVAALEVLRKHPKIDAEALGVWGHSQGGWVVQQLASRLDNLGVAISNSGPTIDVPAQNQYGFHQQVRFDGHTQEEITEALAFLAAMHEAASANEAFSTVQQRLIAPAETAPWFGYFTIENERDWHHIRLLITEPLDPVAALSAVRCPFLTIYGGLDLLVPPWRGAKQSGKALQEAPTGDSTVIVFPDGDHRLQDPTGGFVAGYLDTLADWTASRLLAQPDESAN